MKEIGIFLTIAVLLSGCASAPPTGQPKGMTWYQQGVSAEQMERDLAACQYYAIANVGGYSVQGNTVGQTMLLSTFAQSEQRSRENLMVETRMVALGYSLVKTNSPLLATTPIAEANIVVIEKAKAENGDADAQFDLGNLYCFGFTNNVYSVAIDYTESIKWFQKAAAQNYPNIQMPLAGAYIRRSALEFQNQHLEMAMADCDKAIEIKPDSTEVYDLRGVLRLEKGDLGGAMTDFNNVMALNPKDADAYAGRAEVYYNLQKFGDALADYRACCQVTSNVRLQDGCHFNIWVCRARLGELNDATKELQA
jgi:tetratricopeptide (TPR) repeat protein